MHHGGYRCWYNFSKGYLNWKDGAECTKCHTWTKKYIRVSEHLNDALWLVSHSYGDADIPLTELKITKDNIKNHKLCSCSKNMSYLGKGKYWCSDCDIAK